MVKRIGGSRRKSRHKMQKPRHLRGKTKVSDFLKSFNNGDKVVLKADPSYQSGMYHPRFHGKVGTIVGSRGNSYEVEINDFTVSKRLIVHPIHLKRLKI